MFGSYASEAARRFRCGSTASLVKTRAAQPSCLSIKAGQKAISSLTPLSYLATTASKWPSRLGPSQPQILSRSATSRPSIHPLFMSAPQPPRRSSNDQMRMTQQVQTAVRQSAVVGTPATASQGCWNAVKGAFASSVRSTGWIDRRLGNTEGTCCVCCMRGTVSFAVTMAVAGVLIGLDKAGVINIIPDSGNSTATADPSSSATPILRYRRTT